MHQKHGSQVLRSFVAPIESVQPGGGPPPPWRTLPDTAVGRNVLSGTATPNGLFLVTVEDGVVRLLTLRGAYEGGLTCLPRTLDARLSSKNMLAGSFGISIAIKERYGTLQVTVMDSRGHVVEAEFNVEGMPPAEAPLVHQAPEVELPPDWREPIGELPTEFQFPQG